MRQTKMVEWMENVEKAISRIMADKVYTSAEFKRERDNFHVRFFICNPVPWESQGVGEPRGRGLPGVGTPKG